jgi:hypothetical protein
MIPKKLAPDLIRWGCRFPEKIMPTKVARRDTKARGGSTAAGYFGSFITTGHSRSKEGVAPLLAMTK